MLIDENKIISETKNWIQKVVIANNFCPFAAKAIVENKIRYSILKTETDISFLEYLKNEFNAYNNNENLDTGFIILPESCDDFEDFLQVLDYAEQQLLELGYEGIYQFAHFHPDYIFEGNAMDDPSNYTNRSIYPMLQILRESSVEKAIAHYPEVELIPEKNIARCISLGLEKMRELREKSIG